ncbi:hypothetical protein BD410DRAFT_810195 [Rickenella mellea]|uniref:Uncharacterized protein n=1 Tax=Rickenella mellea TaxID=50990 RepID=A0A4Y7PG87_9AGAM|nr:hypothetical protein BD410DRAFT_810195 [Rickenella mellea]
MDATTILFDSVFADLAPPVVFEPIEGGTQSCWSCWQWFWQWRSGVVVNARDNTSSIFRETLHPASKLVVGYLQEAGRFKLKEERAVCPALGFTRLFPGHSVGPAVQPPTLKMADALDLPPPSYQFLKVTKLLPTADNIPLDGPLTPQQLADLGSRVTGLCVTRLKPFPIPPPASGTYTYFMVTRGAEIGLYNDPAFSSWRDAFAAWVQFLDETFGVGVEPGLWVRAFCPEMLDFAQKAAESKAVREFIMRDIEEKLANEQEEPGDVDAAESDTASCPTSDEMAHQGKDEDNGVDDDDLLFHYVVLVGVKPGVYGSRERAHSAVGSDGRLLAFDALNEADRFFVSRYMRGEVRPTSTRRFL